VLEPDNIRKVGGALAEAAASLGHGVAAAPTASGTA
jgi:hypothetical protein